MLRFTSIEPDSPEKRPADARAHDFHEVYAGYAAQKAAEQASRCSQCGVPFCQVHCPLTNNIPDWLKLTAEGRTEEAYELSQATNNMPEICGRICPQDRLCEGNCVIEQSGHGTVTIGAVEKFLTDTAWKNGWVHPLRARIEQLAAITSQLAPPTEVESIQRGVRPRYSPTSIGGMMPVEVEPRPSMSAGVRPASATARLLAWAISPYGVADGTLPTSESATPAIATRRFMPRPRPRWRLPARAAPSCPPSSWR